ncbi:MAG: hypothetical protein ACR2JR_13820 [Rubrobacteraceae bacterium]
MDDTDKEINAAEHGGAPDDYDFFVTGHEPFGRVLEVGPNAPPSADPASNYSPSPRGRGLPIGT